MNRGGSARHGLEGGEAASDGTVRVAACRRTKEAGPEHHVDVQAKDAVHQEVHGPRKRPEVPLQGVNTLSARRRCPNDRTCDDENSHAGGRGVVLLVVVAVVVVVPVMGGGSMLIFTSSPRLVWLSSKQRCRRSGVHAAGAHRVDLEAHYVGHRHADVEQQALRAHHGEVVSCM
jgi:hypothetical protein